MSLDSLKIAGGVILMFLAIDILFEKRKIRREKRVEEALDERNFDEITVFPIAIPPCLYQPSKPRQKQP